MSTIDDWSEETRGLCPVCLRDVPAMLLEENERIWIRQMCGRHGESRALPEPQAVGVNQNAPDRVGQRGL